MSIPGNTTRNRQSASWWDGGRAVGCASADGFNGQMARRFNSGTPVMVMFEISQGTCPDQSEGLLSGRETCSGQVRKGC